MITIDASFWASVGVDSSDGNANGNQRDFYNSMVVNGVAVNNQKDFFQNSTVNGIVYYNQWDWYKAIGTFYSEPIYDQYSFYQNVTFDGINKVGNQKDFFNFILGIRYFTTLDGAADYYTIPTVTLTGDFEIECQFSLTDLTGDMVLFGDGATGFDYLRIDPVNGGLDIRYNNGFTSNDGQFTADNKLHTASLKRVGGTVFAYYDGVQVNTRTVSTSFTVEMLGSRLNNYLNGVISEVKITDGTDLIRYYKIDEDLSTTSTIIDSGSDGSNGTAVSISSSELFTLEGADWIGAELVTNGDFATDLSGWTIGGTDGTHTITWVSGEAHYESDTTSPLLFMQQIILTVGLNYKAKVYNNIISQNLQLTGLGVNILTSGDNEIIATSDATTLIFKRNAVNTDVYIDNVSVKRILQAP